MSYLVLYEKRNGCYGAKYVTLFCMEKHQGVWKFNTNSKTLPKYILKTSKSSKLYIPPGLFCISRKVTDEETIETITAWQWFPYINIVV